MAEKDSANGRLLQKQKPTSDSMSKLSEPLKALINAAHARPNTIKAPPNIRTTYARIADSARSHNVGVPAFLTLSTAATMTMNSPDSMMTLYDLSRNLPNNPLNATQTAEFMREAGLKCISFNGIPRTINMLNAFRDSLPAEIGSTLSTKSTRELSNENLSPMLARGSALWTSIYAPFETKLIEKLARSHPNMPVHILSAHYGTLLADPDTNMPIPVSLGRVLTSILAIACLRAQTGVGPQVLSHVFGLRKAFGDGSAEGEDVVQGGKWLATDEGSTWILDSIDEIVRAIGQGRGTSFAQGMVEPILKAKL